MIAKVAILAALMGMAYCGIHGGFSNTYRKQEPHGHYSFGYDIVGHDGAKNSRHEHGGPGHAAGSYQIHDIDGRARTVHYVGDKLGFRAKIHTNEPGTVQHYAAAAAYAGPHKVPSHGGVQFGGHDGQLGGGIVGADAGGYY